MMRGLGGALILLTDCARSQGVTRFADGRLITVIDSVYTLERAAEAHRRMASNANIGKIILRVP